MHPNEELISDFYTAFQNQNGKIMADFYSDSATFEDPVFALSSKEEIGSMWNMLCTNAQEFELIFYGIEADDNQGTAKWEAKYRFSKTKRLVHNKITAKFKLENGKILSHLDSFSFWRWSCMAFGPLGVVLGWTKFLHKKVKAEASKSLRLFIKSKTKKP